jgi:benzodiazapine receptor
MSPILKLVLALVICFAAAGIGGFATATGVNSWYMTLNKPSFNPPNWLFGPVWSLLYTMMAIALWGIWKQPASVAVSTAMTWFFIQLALNCLWSFSFFYFESPAIGLVTIILMWAAILITILKFWPIQAWTAYLLIPYLLWVSFATLLNAAIWWLN